MTEITNDPVSALGRSLNPIEPTRMALRNREIQAVTAAALESTFDWSVRPSYGTAPEQDSVRIGSSVRISGCWEGEIAVFLSPELARRAADSIYEGHVTTGEKACHDAVRQIAGQIGAEIQERLPRPCELHIPSPVTISGGTIRRARRSALLDCDGEPCWVLVDGPAVEEITQLIEPSRRFSRADIQLGVTVRAAGTVHRSTGPGNLSMNGVFVPGESTIPLGHDCVVTVHVGPRDAESVQVTGRVTRVTPTGFAVEFLEVDLESYRQLRDLVHLNSRAPTVEGPDKVRPDPCVNAG